MKEKPIIFSGKMVRAILAGDKTQTRRVVTLPRWADHSEPIEVGVGGVPECVCQKTGCLAGIACPYGKPSDRLWVREKWWQRKSDGVIVFDADGALSFDKTSMAYRMGIGNIACEGDNSELPALGFRKRPSIHMPRWASRITLEVTDVRVERVQDISEEDAQDEGVPWPNPETDVVRGKTHPTCIDVFAALWDKINGKRGVCKTCNGHGCVVAWSGSVSGGSLEKTADDCPDCHGEDKSYSWANNPWVWVVDFKPIEQEVS